MKTHSDLLLLLLPLLAGAATATAARLDESPSRHPVVVERQSNWTVGQTVQTTSGSVQGHAAANASDVSEYLGIPFAQPPVGNLRFQPPRAYNGSGTINGTNFGFSCMSTRLFKNFSSNATQDLEPTAVGPYLLEQFIEPGSSQDEDCLTLNIWAKPQTGETAKAVLLWIYGGGFITGSSANPWYNGQWIAEDEDVVVVSINYRLSIFGFPGNPTSAPNLGLLDQRLAVEWVRDNIRGFGGDPSRITLFGQSAGGASVDYYSYAWVNDTIVAGLIAESGTATGFGLQTNATANELWFNATATAGCGGSSDDHDAVFQCMLQKPAATIVQSVPADAIGELGSGLPFAPVVDGVLVFANYTNRAPAAVPLLIGNNDFEAGFFRLAAPNLPEAFWLAFDQKAFVCPAGGRAAYSVLNGNPTWRYRYFGEFPNMRLYTNPDSGAWHGSEIPLLFNTTPIAIAPNTAAEDAIAAYMRGAWAAFAKDPAAGLLAYGGGWPRYSSDDSTLVRLGYANQTGTNLGTGDAYDVGCPAVPVVTSPVGNASTSTTATATATATGTSTGAATSVTGTGVAGRAGPAMVVEGVIFAVLAQLLIA